MTATAAASDGSSLARLHNPADIEWALAAERAPLLPSVAERSAWREIATRAGESRTHAIVERAEAAAAAVAAGVPTISASLYLDYSRTGGRERHREPFKTRRSRLADLTLAECLEADGRFLDPILDLAWAICEESSWALPAHQHDLASPESSMLDLTAAMTALDLAELVVLLGERLVPGLVARIYDEVDRRCFVPYLYRNDHHWLFNSTRFGVNNWAAVCNAGVLGAALHLEADDRRTAQIVYKGLRSLDDYLATFTADGGSSEGPGYWTYGFGYFTMLSDLLERATGGALDPVLQVRAVRGVAKFPLRTELEPGSYVTFSDTDPQVRYWRPHLEHLGRKLGLAELEALGRGEPLELPEVDLARSLRGLLWVEGPAAVAYVADEVDATGASAATGIPSGRSLSACDWLPDLQWMIARLEPGTEESLVVAVKGGHNGEMHNHNDVGNLIVRCGGETLLPDLGRGRYTREYFGPDRYELFVRSSAGHSVPLVNGQPQGPRRFEMKGDGGSYAASVVRRSASGREDVLELELAAAYERDSGLESLRRRVSLEREERRVRLVDDFSFTASEGLLESVLITLGKVECVAGEMLIVGRRKALSINVVTSAVEVEVEELEDVELANGPRTVRRIVLRHPPAKRGRIELLLTPETVGRGASSMIERRIEPSNGVQS